MVLFDFAVDADLNNWYIVDDGVMGGRSQGNHTISKDGHGVFKGEVSLENNGGFSSLRHAFHKKDIASQTHFVLRLKGDGKVYQFRAKSSRNQRFSYIAEFETSGNWETIRIPMASMYPAFRGYKLNQPNFPGESLAEIAFLIGNKTAESFELHIDKISLD